MADIRATGGNSEALGGLPLLARPPDPRVRSRPESKASDQSPFSEDLMGFAEIPVDEWRLQPRTIVELLISRNRHNFVQ